MDDQVDLTAGDVYANRGIERYFGYLLIALFVVAFFALAVVGMERVEQRSVDATHEQEVPVATRMGDLGGTPTDGTVQ